MNQSRIRTIKQPWETRLDNMKETGLSYAGIVFVESFMLAQQDGRGEENRSVLLERIRCATPQQKQAAIGLFDDFCKAKGI